MEGSDTTIFGYAERREAHFGKRERENLGGKPLSYQPLPYSCGFPAKPPPPPKRNFLVQNSMHLCMNTERWVEMAVKDESVRDHRLFLLTRSGSLHTMSYYSSADCFCQEPERYTPVLPGRGGGR